MKVKRLGPKQIAVTLDHEEFKALLDKQLSPELRAEGFEVAAVEGPSGGWLIMLRKK
jgi:hypothetical protein